MKVFINNVNINSIYLIGDKILLINSEVLKPKRIGFNDNVENKALKLVNNINDMNYIANNKTLSVLPYYKTSQIELVFYTSEEMLSDNQDDEWMYYKNNIEFVKFFNLVSIMLQDETGDFKDKNFTINGKNINNNNNVFTFSGTLSGDKFHVIDCYRKSKRPDNFFFESSETSVNSLDEYNLTIDSQFNILMNNITFSNSFFISVRTKTDNILITRKPLYNNTFILNQLEGFTENINKLIHGDKLKIYVFYKALDGKYVLISNEEYNYSGDL